MGKDGVRSKKESMRVDFYLKMFDYEEMKKNMAVPTGGAGSRGLKNSLKTQEETLSQS